jgi:hypothetical protein
MRLDESIRIAADVVTREIGEETFLLNLANGTYYGLDAVGARFLGHIEQGASITDARDALLALYDVEPAVLNSDLEGLLDALLLNGVIERSSEVQSR